MHFASIKQDQGPLGAAPIVVFGAAGGTGAHVVRLASPGPCRAVVREPARVIFFQGLPGVQLVEGDVLDVEAVRRAMAGSTLAVFACSGRTGRQWAEREGLRNVARVCADRGAKLCVVSSIFCSRRNRLHPVRVLLNLYTWGIMDAKADGEAAVRALVASSPAFKYCIIRPSRLTDADASQFQWAISQGDKPWFGRRPIARGDVARICLAALLDPACDRTTFEVSGPHPASKTPASTDDMFDSLARDPV